METITIREYPAKKKFLVSYPTASIRHGERSVVSVCTLREALFLANMARNATGCPIVYRLPV